MDKIKENKKTDGNYERGSLLTVLKSGRDDRYMRSH